MVKFGRQTSKTANCSTRFVDAHHIEHWLDGGQTKLSNLVSVCRRHHRFVHEWGYSIERQAGKLVFRGPEGQPMVHAWPRQALGDAELALTARSRRAGVLIDGSTNLPGWDGRPVDYGLCIESLAAG